MVDDECRERRLYNNDDSTVVYSLFKDGRELCRPKGFVRKLSIFQKFGVYSYPNLNKFFPGMCTLSLKGPCEVWCKRSFPSESSSRRVQSESLCPMSSLSYPIGPVSSPQPPVGTEVDFTFLYNIFLLVITLFLPK